MSTHILKITIVHVRPAIWRRLWVPSGLRLDEFHDALQIAFGWENRHLHEFRVGPITYGPADPDGDMDLPDETGEAVWQALPNKSSRLQYIYNPADGWIHNVSVEHIEPLSTSRASRGLRSRRSASAITCLDGERAAPPEDCGGPAGYAELLRAIGDPHHPRFPELLGYASTGFEPERLSLPEVNRGLSQFARESRLRNEAAAWQ